MKIFRQKTFQRFWVSYLLVLILPLFIVSLFMMWYNTQVLMEEARETSYLGVVQTNELIDREFSELKEVAIQIGSNQDVRRIMFEQDPVEWQYARWQVLNEMMALNTSEQFPEEILIYFHNTQEFLSASSYYDVELFYQKYPMDDRNQESLIGWLTEGGQDYSRVSTQDGLRNYLLYKSSIPMNENSNRGTVLMFVDWETILPMFSTPSEKMEQYDYILDIEGNLLYASSEEGEAYLPRFAAAVQGQELQMEQEIDGRAYLITSVTSDILPLQYVTVMAMSDVLSSVAMMRTNFILILLFCILFGVIGSFWLSRRNYQPIVQLLEYAESGTLEDKRQAYEEFGKVIDQLDALFTQNRSLMQSMEKQIPSMRYSFAANLLAGRYRSQESVASMEELLDIHFPSENFAVVITRVEDYSRFTQEDEKNLSLVNFALQNVFREIMENDAVVLDVPAHKEVSFILCFRGTVASLAERLDELLHQFYQFVAKVLNIEVSIGVGEVTRGITSIMNSCEQAKWALNQRFLYGQGNVSVYHSDDLLKGNRYYYPIDQETQLINRMKQGNTREALRIAEAVFEENMEKRQLPVQIGYCMMFNMLGTVLKVLNDTGIEYNLSGLVTQMLDTMLRQGNMQNLRGQLLDAITNICHQIEINQESGNIQLRLQILQYLEENYMDSNLSLALLADSFHLSGPYLSRYFKDQTGMNFADYLCRLRIQKAKELLKEEISIQEIAERVGYNSSNSFIRTFKRYESITPGTYREQLRQK